MSKEPSTPLDAYLKQAGISDADFATQIKRDRSIVNKLRRGKIKQPTFEVAMEIERATDGAIPMQAWTDLPTQAEAA
jgi:transcriptional regulator with XRE-family HTH domain